MAPSPDNFGAIRWCVLTSPKWRDLSKLDQNVYLALLVYSFGNGKAWPSRGTLARDLGCTSDSIKRSIRRLVDAGFVEREGTHRGRKLKLTGSDAVPVDGVHHGPQTGADGVHHGPRTGSTTVPVTGSTTVPPIQKGRQKEEIPPTPQGGKSGGRAKSKNPDPPRPADLKFKGCDTEACRMAWGAWLVWKIKIDRRYKTHQGMQAALTRVNKWGEERMVEAIEYSIGREWDGVYEPNGQETRQQQFKQADAAASDRTRKANRAQQADDDRRQEEEGAKALTGPERRAALDKLKQGGTLSAKEPQ